MTDFEISLLASGGAFIFSVLVFNKWQEYRAKRSVDRTFSSGHDDVLMKEELDHALTEKFRHEPSLDGNSDMAQEPHFEKNEPDEINDVSQEAVPVKPPLVKELPVDELIDCIIPLEFDTPIRGEKILLDIHHFKYIGKKPVHFIGLNQAGERDVIAHGGAYTSLFAGIQLVSRDGPLTELEYSEFVSKLRELGDKLNAHADIPDMNRVMSTARELHQFVSEHDAQLSVNVISGGAPWAINTLLAALEKQGFDVRPDGRLAMPDGDGGVLFTLSTNISVSETVTSRLTLLLDVPCVAPERDGFGALAACAKSLAVRLGGSVVDDSSQPISKAGLDEISAQVSEFYSAMEEAQVPAGSVRSLRLFS